MKTLHLSIIAICVLIGSSFGIVNAMLEDGLPTAGGGLHPSETQKVINESLSIPELQNWSHDWQFVDMGFVSAKNMPGLLKYAIVDLKAPSSSAPIPCDNDWWAWVEVDLATYQVVSATYPTMESHNCQVATGGGPQTNVPNSNSTELSNSTKLDSPLKQFDSGIALKNIVCVNGFTLVIKAEDKSPACVKPENVSILVERGWAVRPHSLQEQLDFANVCLGSNDACKHRLDLLGNATNYTSSGNNTLPVSFMPCDTPYPQTSTGVAVLYMPMNSIGKICVRYSNLNDFHAPVGIRIFEANNMSQDATEISTWNDLGNNATISKGNSTVVYWIKTGNQAGFYGLSIFCGGTPFAVGYNNNSNIVSSDFPWVGKTTSCPLMTYDYHVDSLTGIGVKYIPSPQFNNLNP
jgi:hypothetical protein